jgi:hypothetical protein
LTLVTLNQVNDVHRLKELDLRDNFEAKIDEAERQLKARVAEVCRRRRSPSNS